VIRSPEIFLPFGPGRLNFQQCISGTKALGHPFAKGDLVRHFEQMEFQGRASGIQNQDPRHHIFFSV
jgi:hypothetical protein